MNLRPLTIADENAAIDLHVQLKENGFDLLLYWNDQVDWADYLATLSQQAQGVNLAPDMVRATFLVAEVSGELVGRVSIRFDLNDYLARWGGHIGYAVGPAFRGQGYATEILRKSVEIARSGGVGKILVVCDDTNIASARTIEKCGGVFESLSDGPPGSPTDAPKPLRRYWIS